MSLEGQQLVARDGVPDLARAVVAARDEFVTRLVERTVCEGQNVRAKNLEQKEIARFIAF